MLWTRKRNWGMLMLGIWLVVTGMTPFVNITAVNMVHVSALLAIVAGLAILLGR